ncbi:ribulose-phosphate 3-epimerase, partial [Acidobacteria bacterium AH-259-O06]|nr:ribulose-phosphate 3-epimerase [Acidobacteria bacterium AH-259-O06]
RRSSPTISVGVLAADLMSLGSELSLLEQTDVELAHVDVMDGCFTPMMTVGPPFIEALKTPLLKDVHLMIQEPLEKVDAYVAAGADVITVHAESSLHIHRVLQKLGEMTNANDPVRGLVRGVALNPGTPLTVLEPLLDEVELIMFLAINPGWEGQTFIPSTFSRITKVKQMIARAGKDILICVDGGIKRNNIADVATAGVDIIVTGSAVFDGKAPVENARFMLDTLRSQHASR